MRFEGILTIHAHDEYTEMKTIWLDVSESSAGPTTD